MLKSTLKLVFTSLTKEEWLGFHKNLLGITKSSTDLYKLFSYFQKNKNRLEKLPDLETVRSLHFEHLTPKGLSNLMSKLMGILERWLAAQQLEKTAYQKELLLIKTYNNRGLYKLANRVAQKLETKILKGDLGLHAENLTKLYDAQYYSNNPIKSENPTLFKDLINCFSQDIKNKSLLYLLELENKSAKRGFAYAEEEKKELEKVVSIEVKNDLAIVLELVLEAVRNPNEYKLRKSLDQIEQLCIEKGSDIYLILISYLALSLRGLYHTNQLENIGLFLETHQLRFEAIKQNSNHKLLPVHFFNQVNLISIYSGYDQTTTFISEWSSSVHSKFPESVLSFAKALNAFRNERYEALPELLSTSKFDNFQYKMEGIILLIIAHYKSGDEELLHSMIPNFKKQLKRNKAHLAARNYLGLNNLVDVILLLSKSKYDKTISVDLADFQPIFYKNWIEKEMKIH